MTNLNNLYRLPYLALYRLLLTNALTRELISTARKRNKLTKNAKRRKPDANWVKNISSGPLDEIETQVLSYGLKHSVTPKQIPTEAIVSGVEAVLSRQHEPSESTKVKVVPLLRGRPPGLLFCFSDLLIHVLKAAMWSKQWKGTLMLQKLKYSKKAHGWDMHATSYTPCFQSKVYIFNTLVMKR